MSDLIDKVRTRVRKEFAGDLDDKINQFITTVNILVDEIKTLNKNIEKLIKAIEEMKDHG